MAGQNSAFSEKPEPVSAHRPFLTGSRQLDTLAFVIVLLLMLLAGYRLRVYFRSLPTRAKQTTFRKMPTASQCLLLVS